MLRQVLLAGLFALVGLLSSMPELGQAASTHHQVRGTVQARMADAQPQTIVVTTGSGSAEVTVGAIVQGGTPIRRGGKSIHFDQIRIGDMVRLTYQKTRQGLVAVSIVVQSTN